MCRCDQCLAWYRVHGPFRQKLKYQKLPHHYPKEPNTTRTDWRKRKGFVLDRQKKHCGMWQHYPKRWHKKEANHAHRAFERDKIHHEKWDDLCNETLRLFFDPWDIY